jgi:hypothetical protein
MKRVIGVQCVNSFGSASARLPAASTVDSAVFRWCVFLLAASLAASPVSAETSQLSFDFQSDQVGEQPRGFYFDRTGRGTEGDWRVVEDGESHVLAQVDRAREKQRLALAVVENAKLKDVKLQVKIKCVAGEREATGGVVWRYRDSENYLLARIDVMDNRVRLYRVVNGNLATFGREDDLKLKPDTWYTLRVEHKGRTIKVYLDDEALIVERDRHFRDAGKVGLWTKADAKTYFDDLRFRDANNDH